MAHPQDVLGFGSQADWVALYDERYQRALDLDIAVQRNEVNLAQAKSGQLNYTEIGVLALESDNMMDAAGNRYVEIEKKIRTAEINVGRHLYSTASGAPQYVTRAIGQPTPNLPVDFWLHVGGSIEAYRFATGQVDPGLILGTGTGEKSWSTDALSNAVDNVQHLQLLQIAASSDPRETAGQFNREVVIGDLGLPPAFPTDELSWEKGTWLGDALLLTRIVEPPQHGLLDDILR